MRQRAVTIVAPIQRMEGLAERLEEWRGSLVAPASLHFLSAFIAPASAALSACLVLEASFDGSTKAFARELVETNWLALSEIYSRCKLELEYRDAQELARALLRHDVGADVFYLGTPGRSVTQIHEERRLHASLRTAFPGLMTPRPVKDPGASIPVEMRRELQRVASLAHEEQWLREPPRRPFWVRHTLRYVGRAKLAGPVVASLVSMIALGPTLGLVLLTSLAVGVPLGLAFAFYAGLGAAPWEQGLPWLLAWGAAVGLLNLYLRKPILHSLRRAAGAVGGMIPLVAIAYGTAHALELEEVTAALLLTSAYFLALVSVAVIVAVIVGRLLRAESSETSWPTTRQIRVEPGNPQEDRQVQNHFASVTLIKPGRFRLRVLRAVLRTVQILARVLFTVGDLGGIRSIHSGRFVILPDGKRLLFSGHYDGSWNSYLGEFAVAHGTTAIWGNTCLRDESGELQGFPRPLLLLFRGARDEQRFKSYALASWTKTLVWYGAYPDLSVQEIDRNTEIHEGLFADMDRDEVALGAWLAKL